MSLLPDSTPVTLNIDSTKMPLLLNTSAPTVTTTEINTRGFKYQVVIDTPMVFTPRRVFQGPSKTREASPSPPTPAESPNVQHHIYEVVQGSFTGFEHSLPTSTTGPDAYIEVEVTMDEEPELRINPQHEEDGLEVLTTELQATNEHLVTNQAEKRDEEYYYDNDNQGLCVCDSDLIRGYLLQEAKHVAERAIARIFPYRFRSKRASKTPAPSRPAI